MFTGLIREIGTLRRRTAGGLAIAAERTADRLAPGDSLAVDGVCLTVTDAGRGQVTVDVAAETRRVTTVASWRTGRRLHLEPALRVGDGIDGHLVLGHVDGVGQVAAVRRSGASVFVTVACGEELARWLLPKGSVAVDGVSLTVDAGPHRDRFTINLVPHTLRGTTFDRVRVGRRVNLEMDVLVKAARGGGLGEVLGGAVGAGPTSGQPKAPLDLAYVLSRGWNRGAS